MKISEVFYNDAGELMAPRPMDVKLGSVTPGGIPSTEAGFYHRFKFEGKTQAELQAKAERFSAEMRSVPGYSKLVARPYTVKMDSYVRHGLDVLYAVEVVAGEPTAPAPKPARKTTTTVVFTEQA